MKNFPEEFNKMGNTKKRHESSESSQESSIIFDDESIEEKREETVFVMKSPILRIDASKLAQQITIFIGKNQTSKISYASLFLFFLLFNR